MATDIYTKRGFLAGLATSKDAVAPSDVPSFSQVQSMVDGIVQIYAAVRLHEHSNFDISTGGLAVVDGVQTVDGDRILLTGQTDATENGIYVAGSGAWSRATDMVTGDTVKAYAHVFVTSGTEGSGHEMAVQSTADVTVDTDNMTWVHAYTFDNDAAHIDVDDTGFSVISGDNAQAALASADTNLGTISTRIDDLSGVSGSDLGTFTGDIISDNTDIKTAAQELETAIESLDVSGQIQTYYDGQRSDTENVSVNAESTVNVTHNLGEAYPSSIAVYLSTGKLVTHSFDIKSIDENTIQIENECLSNLTGLRVVVRK